MNPQDFTPASRFPRVPEWFASLSPHDARLLLPVWQAERQRKADYMDQVIETLTLIVELDENGE